MPSTFPGAIDSFTDPLANSSLASPSHSTLHSDINDAVEKVEQYMGLVKVIPTAATNGTINATTGTVTIGNAVSSVSVTCFSALYENYRILIWGGAGSTAQTMTMQLGASATGYYSALILATYAATPTPSYVGDSNGTSWQYAGGSFVNGNAMDVTLYGPNLAARTGITIHNRLDTRTGGSMGMGNGFHDVATAYTSFTIAVTGTMTGGSIRIYGYRN